MTAYYNEHDPFAAAWLRSLINADMIAPGDVDERSIEDVVPLELAKYTQCHFFAGIGVWSYAMRSAGWPDNRQGWSGSCPCQPFSQAGEGAGFADERHLWPAFFHLIEQCRPGIVFGEQVASPNGLAWLDLVQTDMEGTNYAFGALDQCAAGFGAPHIRQRLYWMAYDAESGRQSRRWSTLESNGVDAPWFESGRFCDVGRVAIPYGGNSSAERQQRGGEQRQQPQDAGVSGLANTINGQFQETGPRPYGRIGQSGTNEEYRRPGPTNGRWEVADWLRCKDGRWRPVEPDSFPLAHGFANRMGLLRGYGNAIVAAQAEEFVKAAMAYAP